MKTRTRMRLLAVALVVVLVIAPLFAGPRDGSSYYALAQQQEASKYYRKAFKSYTKAAAWFVKDGNTQELMLAKNGAYRTESVIEDFGYSPAKFRSAIQKKYPWATKDQIAGWLASRSFVTMDMDGGKTYYSVGEVKNLEHRNQDIMDASMAYQNNPLSNFMAHMLSTYVKADYSGYAIPYDRPKDALADFQLVVKKSLLPKNGDGMVRVWWPMPLRTDCQISNVTLYLEPAHYIVHQTGPDADIGLCYFEIPVAEIEKELVIRSQVRFLHFQQRFEIDPETIGPYDTESELYKKYTAPTFNTEITDQIVARARQIVSNETNPYLQAKLLNDYIIAHVHYSFPEYSVVDAYKTPVSHYVEAHQFGDCGYQSVYFTALCRSLGIPARSTGGYHYLFGKPGSHFGLNSTCPHHTTAGFQLM